MIAFAGKRLEPGRRVGAAYLEAKRPVILHPLADEQQLGAERSFGLRFDGGQWLLVYAPHTIYCGAEKAGWASLLSRGWCLAAPNLEGFINGGGRGGRQRCLLHSVDAGYLPHLFLFQNRVHINPTYRALHRT